jgi:chromosome segregation ATPase
MSANTVRFLVVLVIFGVCYYIFKIHKELKSAQETISEQQERMPASTPKSTPWSEVVSNALRVQKQAELQSLQTQLSAQEQNLASEQSRLSSLQTQAAAPAAQANYMSQIRSTNVQIQNLSDSLRDLQRQEQEINRSASQAMQNQDSAARVAREQLDEQIRAQEGLVHETQDQMAQMRFTYALPGQMPAEYDQLQEQLDAQAQVLANLRAQRVQISADVVAGKQNVQAAAQEQTNDLADQRSNIVNEIGTLRGEIVRMQGAQENQHSSQTSLSSQIFNSQKNISNQTQQIQNLQNAISTKEEELRSLR